MSHAKVRRVPCVTAQQLLGHSVPCMPVQQLLGHSVPCNGGYESSESLPVIEVIVGNDD